MKILIWDKGQKLSNSGGAGGYMYNIHEYLKDHPNDCIDFYSDVKKEDNLDVVIKPESFFQRILKILLQPNICKFAHFLLSSYHRKRNFTEDDLALLKQYDYVHVHVLPVFISLFSKNQIESKVIFTTHFPEPLVDEMSNVFSSKWLLTLCPFIRNYYIKKECDAIRKADLVMLPVKEVLEAYTTKSKYYTDLFNEIEKKLFYVPTSIYPSEAVSVSNSTLLSDYSFPQDSIKICFIGRHNRIKGYDKLQEIARAAWQANPHIYFVIGGKEEPLKRLDDSRWIELGWINTFELLENIDVFILPNQQTFFDLVLIEVLRQGKPCIISNTGGNRWFTKQAWPGVLSFEYDDVSGAVDAILKFATIKQQGKLKEIGQDNHNRYLQSFTVEKYVESYLSQLNWFFRNTTDAINFV